MTIWVLAGVLGLGFALIGAGKVLGVPAMRRRAARLGFSVVAYRGIGLLELAGAFGLLLGVVAPVIGALAGVGTLLLLAGALLTHARHHDDVREAGPALLFGVADAAYLGLTIAAMH